MNLMQREQEQKKQSKRELMQESEIDRLQEQIRMLTAQLKEEESNYVAIRKKVLDTETRIIILQKKLSMSKILIFVSAALLAISVLTVILLLV